MTVTVFNMYQCVLSAFCGRMLFELSPSYNELLDEVTRAVDKIGLERDSESAQSQSQSKLDDCFLASHSSYSPCDLLTPPLLTSPAQPRCENRDMLQCQPSKSLAAHLPPASAPSGKSQPLLPSKLHGCRSSGSSPTYSWQYSRLTRQMS